MNLSEIEAPSYLLHPIGGLSLPRNAPEVRAACDRQGEVETRIVVHDDNAAIIVRGGGRAAEELVRRSVGEALLAVMAPRTVSYRTAQSGDWSVRIYTGALWGLVLGSYMGERPDEGLPPAPEGWRVGREVTDEDRFQCVALAGLDDPAAEALVGRVGALEGGAGVVGG